MWCVCVSQGCFLLDAANFKLKERFSFAELQQITVSSRSDGIVLLRLPVEGPQARVRERERERNTQIAGPTVPTIILAALCQMDKHVIHLNYIDMCI